MQFRSLSHFKSVTAHQFFVAPADQNYLLARWMLINGFGGEFFWQAGQAIEKYLKAGLVLNGVPVANLGHGIEALHMLHREAFGDLSFGSFTKPDSLHLDWWDNETVESFLRHVSRCGDPNSRYGLVGWYGSDAGLFKLDQLVFGLRRLTVGLDWIIGQVWPAALEDQVFAGKTYREALAYNPFYQPRRGFDDANQQLVLPGETRSDLLHSWNFAFVRDSGDLEKPAPSRLRSGMGFVNSYMFLYWQELSKPDPLDPIFLHGMDWLIDNIRLPRDDKQELRQKLQERR